MAHNRIPIDPSGVTTCALCNRTHVGHGVAWNHKCIGPPSPEEKTASGVGSILHSMLSRIGIKPQDCECSERVKEMNNNGPDWCEKNIDIIITWLRDSAKQRKLMFLEWVARRLIRHAIKLHRRGYRVSQCKSCKDK